MEQRGKDKTLQVGQSMDCSSPKSVLQALLATRPESLLEWRASYPYPQVASSYNSLALRELEFLLQEMSNDYYG